MKHIFLLVLLFISIELSFAQDTTNGIVWHPPILLSNDTQNAFQPTIALTGEDTIHVTWFYGRENIRLPYRRSITGGKDFEPMKELLPDSNSFPFQGFRPSILSLHDTVRIFFTV
ncbi:MAG: hypothetical protein HYZ34_02515, partial [Ignavibacteriae bacterium]|nr:hypothetical protein [Ignavibacteriota bacterium]